MSSWNIRNRQPGLRVIQTLLKLVSFQQTTNARLSICKNDFLQEFVSSYFVPLRFYNQSDSNFSNGQMVQPEEIGLVSPYIGDLLASQFTTTSRFIEELRLVRLQLQRENEKKFEPAYYLEMLLASDLRDF